MAFCNKCGNEIPGVANFCPACGNPVSKPNSTKHITDADKRKLQDASVELLHSVTSLVSGTSKLVATLGGIIEAKARSGKGSKELDEALASLGAAVRNVGDSVDELSRKVSGKVEDKIRQK